MSAFVPKDPNYESRVRAVIDLQAAMQTIGASVESVAPGMVQLRMPFNPRFVQQHGYLHAAIGTMLVDTACGCAANPAQGETFIATGEVLKAGRTLTVCSGKVIAVRADGTTTDVASMLTTMMILPGRLESHADSHR
jgi:acyl-coenzyme A thioesterase PaaI-like protein